MKHIGIWKTVGVSLLRDNFVNQPAREKFAASSLSTGGPLSTPVEDPRLSCALVPQGPYTLNTRG